VLEQTGHQCNVSQFEADVAQDPRQSRERVALTVSKQGTPDFTCIIYAVVVPERAFVKKQYTEIDRDAFPSPPGIPTRWADYALVGDEPKLNDARTITRDEVAESVLDSYRAFLRDQR
jgi:hypothetical protein